MSTARITPSPIAGQLTPPPSKSAGHRALICGALALLQQRQAGLTGASCKISRLRDNDSGVMSDDIRATLRALEALGIQGQDNMDHILLTARPELPNRPVTVDCGESGSTLRFFIPILAALGIPAVFTGRGRLPQRPLTTYLDCLPGHGVTLSCPEGDACLPLTLSGRLTGGLYELEGNVSSQFITGLLFALPLCGEDSHIRLTTPLESAGYVEMTLTALDQMGIIVHALGNGWDIPGGQQYALRNLTVEGDWSQAAFLLGMGALGGEVRIPGLKRDSAQGDKAALPLFRRFGAELILSRGIIRCRKAPLRALEIDASQIPDLVPILAVTAAVALGDSRIYNAGRLRIKESDRLAATADCLNRLGARVEEHPDELIIRGIPQLRGGSVPGYGDHRIVMSMAVAALACRNPVEISDAECVQKSWPGFFEDFARLGGNIDVF